MVARYIRWLGNEYGATPSTIRDYEAILARMSLSLADKELIEVSIEDLRDVIDLWGGRTARTRQKVTSVIRAFWSWAEQQGHIALSPAARIRRPRAEQKSLRSCRLTLAHASSARPSTHATVWACSVCWHSGCDARSSRAFRFATSTPS